MRLVLASAAVSVLVGLVLGYWASILLFLIAIGIDIHFSGRVKWVTEAEPKPSFHRRDTRPHPSRIPDRRPRALPRLDGSSVHQD